MIGNERLEESGEFRGIFAGQEQGARSETVFERVAAGSSLTGFRARAGGVSGCESRRSHSFSGFRISRGIWGERRVLGVND
jgi:hypothetical protein